MLCQARVRLPSVAEMRQLRQVPEVPIHIKRTLKRERKPSIIIHVLDIEVVQLLR